MLAPVSRVVREDAATVAPQWGERCDYRNPVDTPKGNPMETSHTAVRNEIVNRLIKSWNFTEEQLGDLSIFHLVNILTLLAGQFGYLGQFGPTICALREILGEEQVFDKPSEIRAKQTFADAAATVPVVN
jgi:hypothetical protein